MHKMQFENLAQIAKIELYQLDINFSNKSNSHLYGTAKRTRI